HRYRRGRRGGGWRTALLLDGSGQGDGGSPADSSPVAVREPPSSARRPEVTSSGRMPAAGRRRGPPLAVTGGVVLALGAVAVAVVGARWAADEARGAVEAQVLDADLSSLAAVLGRVDAGISTDLV